MVGLATVAGNASRSERLLAEPEHDGSSFSLLANLANVVCNTLASQGDDVVSNGHSLVVRDSRCGEFDRCFSSGEVEGFTHPQPSGGILHYLYSLTFKLL